MQLSIIIVSYNVKYFLEQCLASVRLATRQVQAEVWVVDNNSPDGSVAYLQPLFPEVHFIAQAHNAGFACANNVALGRCTGRFVLFLNPDTIVAEDTLVKTVAFMQAHPEAGALGIKMIDGSGRFLPESKRGFPSPLTSLYKQLGLAALFPKSRHFAKYYLGHLPDDATNEVDVLAGAFMLVRKEVLDNIGGFDEDFFMYGEDIDLSYRITKAGWKNYFFADSAIIHFKGESTAKDSLKYVKVFYQAMQLFVRKHFKGNGAALYRMLLFAGISLRASLSAVARLITAFRPAAKQKVIPNTLALQSSGWPSAKQFPAAMQCNDKRLMLTTTAHSDQLLLAIGGTLSAAEAIRVLQNESSSKQCWLHILGTNSMVMSNDKNKAGVAALFTD